MKKRQRREKAKTWPPAAVRPAQHAHALSATPPMQTVALHDPALPERTRERWLAADWQALCTVDQETISHHPERASLAAMRAAAWLQRGDRLAARDQAELALAWGCSRDILGRLLLACAHHTLARASYLAGREAEAQAHFERAAGAARMSSEVRRHVQQRTDQVAAHLQAARQSTALLYRNGSTPAALTAPAWLTGLADRCMTAPDLHDCTDHVLSDELSLPDDRIRFLMLMADRLLAADDRLSGLSFLNAARRFVDGADPGLRIELSAKLVAFGATDIALDMAMQGTLNAIAAPGRPPSPVADALSHAYRRTRAVAQSGSEHGHDLLLAHLERHFESLRKKAAGRALTLIEIGSTREDIPGQGSTRKLAECCLRHGLQFITVDMDPHNSRMARELFARLGAAFEAVTMKGEDYLRERDGPIDLVFLDAYDFDHGKHSELRQSRYEKYLGARIDEQTCHRMHLDCAHSVAGKLWEHGLVCIDDTWLDDGRWTAKGTLAMPYLLDHGFTLVEVRNRAALLARGS